MPRPRDPTTAPSAHLDPLPYVVGAIPRSYAQRFVHEVLLRPLYGKATVLEPGPRAAACRRLIWAWRARLN